MRSFESGGVQGSLAFGKKCDKWNMKQSYNTQGIFRKGGLQAIWVAHLFLFSQAPNGKYYLRWSLICCCIMNSKPSFRQCPQTIYISCLAICMSLWFGPLLFYPLHWALQLYFPKTLAVPRCNFSILFSTPDASHPWIKQMTIANLDGIRPEIIWCTVRGTWPHCSLLPHHLRRCCVTFAVIGCQPMGSACWWLPLISMSALMSMLIFERMRTFIVCVCVWPLSGC